MTDTPQTFFNSQHTFLRSDQTMVGKWWWTMDRWLLGTVEPVPLADIREALRRLDRLEAGGLDA